MPSQYVGIEDLAGHRVAVGPTGRLLTTTVPEEYKFYFHTIIDAPGAAASNNFLTIFNPIGSGRILSFFQAEVSAYSVAASGGSASLVAYRITAASGGTLHDPAQMSRFLTLESDPVAEVRFGNPAMTIDPAFPAGLNSWQPPQTTGVGGSVIATTQAPGEGFACLPGQGIGFNTASGDTDQRWKINTIWAEVPF